MAIINKTGITNGGTIQAEHVTRAIDALSGGSADTVVATGSFSGSLTGTATSASFATTASFALNAAAGIGFPYTGSAQITGSLIVTGSVTVTTGSVTFRNGLVTSGSNQFDGSVTITDDVMITGSLTYYYASGSLDALLDDKDRFFAYGEIISGNTANASANSCSAVYLTTGSVWDNIDQMGYDLSTFPLMGVALNNSSNGSVLLSGYITGFKVGGTPSGGIPIQDDTTIRVGQSVFVRDSSVGLYSTANPGGITGGPILQIGHVIHRSSALADKYVIKVNPRWLYTV